MKQPQPQTQKGSALHWLLGNPWSSASVLHDRVPRPRLTLPDLMGGGGFPSRSPALRAPRPLLTSASYLGNISDVGEPCLM